MVGNGGSLGSGLAAAVLTEMVGGDRCRRFRADHRGAHRRVSLPWPGRARLRRAAPRRRCRGSRFRPHSMCRLWTCCIRISIEGTPRPRESARRLMEVYEAMGCEPTWTCAPYQLPAEARIRSADRLGRVERHRVRQFGARGEDQPIWGLSRHRLRRDGSRSVLRTSHRRGPARHDRGPSLVGHLVPTGSTRTGSIRSSEASSGACLRRAFR